MIIAGIELIHKCIDKRFHVFYRLKNLHSVLIIGLNNVYVRLK